jgi:hypothetical protein
VADGGELAAELSGLDRRQGFWVAGGSALAL